MVIAAFLPPSSEANGKADTPLIALDQQSPSMFANTVATIHITPGPSNAAIAEQKQHLVQSKQVHIPSMAPHLAPQQATIALQPSGDSVVALLIQKAVTERFGANQVPSAIELLQRESGLNPYAKNKSSGACGLAQALPCSKLLNKIGSLDNIEGQVKWFLDYVQDRYSTPNKALLFHKSQNWY